MSRAFSFLIVALLLASIYFVSKTNQNLNYRLEKVKEFQEKCNDEGGLAVEFVCVKRESTIYIKDFKL